MLLSLNIHSYACWPITVDNWIGWYNDNNMPTINNDVETYADELGVCDAGSEGYDPDLCAILVANDPNDSGDPCDPTSRLFSTCTCNTGNCSALDNNTNRTARPVVLGNKLNNPFSLQNMKAALVTLKANPDQLSRCMKAPSTTLEGIVIEPTDLYVRYLPVDSIQSVKLMTDSTLILFDYPLDYEKVQAGDYYKDSTVTGKYTWLYATVPIGYQPQPGIRFEVIEELFIPEHSPNYSQGLIPSNINGITRVISSINANADNTDALKTLEAISFIITGNGTQLNIPTAGNTPTGMQKSTSTITKHFLGWSWKESVYNPEGYINVYTPNGIKPLANIRVRVARYFTYYETRTDANGRFYFNNQFGQNPISPNIEYFVYFDGQNGSNYWSSNFNSKSGTEYTSLGVHSPDTYSITFTASNGYWGRCVEHWAINNYIDMARRDGISLPPAKLNIISDYSSDYLKYFPLLKNNILGNSNSDMVLHYQNTYSNYCKIIASTWHKFTNASQVSKMLSLMGTTWTTGYWNAVQNQLKDDDSHGLNDCFAITHKQKGDCSQQIALTEGWASYREETLVLKYLGAVGYYATLNPYLRQFINMFRKLNEMGCSFQCLERSLCSYTIAGFRSYLISYYPSLSQQISSIIPNPDYRIPGNITFMTYNLRRGDWDLSSRINALGRVISCSNPDVVAVQEVEGQSNFDILKRETGLDGATCLTKPNEDYGIGLLWKPSLGTPIISRYYNIPTDGSETSAYVVAEFADFYFISTHYHSEFPKISDAIIALVKSVNKPVYIGGDFNMNLNSEPKDIALEKYVENGFIFLNKLGDVTTFDDKWLKDLLIGYKKKLNCTQCYFDRYTRIPT